MPLVRHLVPTTHAGRHVRLAKKRSKVGWRGCFPQFASTQVGIQGNSAKALENSARMNVAKPRVFRMNVALLSAVNMKATIAKSALLNYVLFFNLDLIRAAK
jgi:hypothetical protein